MNTIIEAKRHLRENFNTGTNCPCCGQFVKLYKRKLGSSQSRSLILLYSLNQKSEWIHSREITKKINITGDFAKLVYWNLILEKPKSKEDKRSSGFWKLTQRGKDFVLGNIKIPSHVFIYNASLQGFSNEQIFIHSALGKKFSYNELMNI